MNILECKGCIMSGRICEITSEKEIDIADLSCPLGLESSWTTEGKE